MFEDTTNYEYELKKAHAEIARMRHALEEILLQTDEGPVTDWHGMLGTVTIKAIARDALGPIKPFITDVNIAPSWGRDVQGGET